MSGLVRVVASATAGATPGGGRAPGGRGRRLPVRRAPRTRTPRVPAVWLRGRSWTFTAKVATGCGCALVVEGLRVGAVGLFGLQAGDLAVIGGALAVGAVTGLVRLIASDRRDEVGMRALHGWVPYPSPVPGADAPAGVVDGPLLVLTAGPGGPVRWAGARASAGSVRGARRPGVRAIGSGGAW